MARVPLSTVSAADLLDPEPIPPLVIEPPTRRSTLRGRPVPRR